MEGGGVRCVVRYRYVGSRVSKSQKRARESNSRALLRVDAVR